MLRGKLIVLLQSLSLSIFNYNLIQSLWELITETFFASLANRRIFIGTYKILGKSLINKKNNKGPK